MRLWSLGFLCLLVPGGFLPALAQQPSGPRTLEDLLTHDEDQKLPASRDATATESGRARTAPTVVRPHNGVQHPDLDKAWAEYDAAVSTASESVKAAIAKQFDAAAAKGDLDAAEKWQAIGASFEQRGELPAESATKATMSGIDAAYKRAKDKLIKAYEAAQKALTMEKKISEAKAVRNEKDTLLASPRPRPAPAATPVPRSEPEWEDITAALVGGTRRDKLIVSQGKARVMSSKPYSAPVEIEYVCATNRNNIRLGYACDSLIFNWEMNRNELRIDGGPADGQHVMNAGAVPVGKMVTIRQVVTPTEMTVFVDGQKRASWMGTFSHVNELIEVFSLESELSIKSVRVRKGRR